MERTIPPLPSRADLSALNGLSALPGIAQPFIEVTGSAASGGIMLFNSVIDR
jgi:hypothetical protein